MDLLKLLNLPDIINKATGQYMELISKYFMVAAIPVLIIALVNCFFGYKVFKILVAFAGTVIGALCGAGISIGINMFTSKQMPTLTAIIIAALVGAVVLGFFSFKLYKAGAFCMGFITGMALGVLIMKLMNKDEYIIAGVIGGLLMGLLAIDLYRHVVIILTSINGGIISSFCISTLLKKDAPMFILKLGIILTVAGIIVQYILLFAQKNRENEKEEEKDKFEVDEKEKSREDVKIKNPVMKENKRKAAKKASKNDKRTHNTKRKKRTKRTGGYDFESEFFLVEFFSDIAQTIKDFILNKIDHDYEEIDEDSDIDKECETKLVHDLNNYKKKDNDLVKKDTTYEELKNYEKALLSNQTDEYIIEVSKIDDARNSEVPEKFFSKKPEYLPDELKEMEKAFEKNHQIEEFNSQTIDLDEISHKLEEELEQSMEKEKEKELENLIIKEGMRNLEQ